MTTPFNQVPPKANNKPLWFNVDCGDLFFTHKAEESPHNLIVYSEGAVLTVESHDMKFTKLFPDHDEQVDVFLHACWEMIDEVIPRLSFGV